MAGRKPAKKADDFVEDVFPRRKPPETEEPPNWRMAALHVDQAALALRGTERNSDVRNNIKYNLEKALAALYPAPADL